MINKKLFEILPETLTYKIIGNDVVLEALELDSRKVQKNTLYAAIKGSSVDGHDFIESAIDLGAKCILCSEKPSKFVADITYVVVDDVATFLGRMLHKFFDLDQFDFQLIGVTGTNGKTTVVTLLFDLFSQLGFQCGMISTVKNMIGSSILAATHTTPDVVQLYGLIHKMLREGCKYIFMEVSSHALIQKRVAGLIFNGALFTNISHDHLDYHGSMIEYIRAKKLFFDDLNRYAFAITNKDDKNGLVMVQNTKAKVRTYGIKSMADYKTKILENSVLGLSLKINQYESFFRMMGTFNAYNLTLVFATVMQYEQDPEKVLAILSNLSGAEGRFESILSSISSKIGIVDYAHTPDALDNVLKTLLAIKATNAEIITVVGCGGDRDKTKRPKMTQIACKYSDKVVITSDNPRTERPESILDDMERGLTEDQKAKVVRIEDRYQAIKIAHMIAGNNSIILVAGKGHETYQEINGQKYPFDDKKVLKEILG